MKTVNVKELRENLDTYIEATRKGRSFTVIRRSKPVFRIVPVDEWGDEGTWETVADFTKVNPKGISLDDAIASLRRVHGQNR